MNMKKIIYVPTGKIRVSKGLISVGALGSCIAVILHSKKNKVGGLAHVMLPGKAPDREKRNKTKYAEDAINKMMNKMSKLGADKNSIQTYLIGGANVLKEKNSNIGKDNINSVIEFLKKKELRIYRKVVGGTQRRSVRFDVENSIIHYTEGSMSRRIVL
jgi:chemotaxis protein CheD